MDREGFLKYLQDRDIPDQEIEQHVLIVELFERFLQDARTAENASV